MVNDGADFWFASPNTRKGFAAGSRAQTLWCAPFAADRPAFIVVLAAYSFNGLHIEADKRGGPLGVFGDPGVPPRDLLRRLDERGGRRERFEAADVYERRDAWDANDARDARDAALDRRRWARFPAPVPMPTGAELARFAATFAVAAAEGEEEAAASPPVLSAGVSVPLSGAPRASHVPCCCSWASLDACRWPS